MVFRGSPLPVAPLFCFSVEVNSAAGDFLGVLVFSDFPLFCSKGGKQRNTTDIVVHFVGEVYRSRYRPLYVWIQVNCKNVDTEFCWYRDPGPCRNPGKSSKGVSIRRYLVAGGSGEECRQWHSTSVAVGRGLPCFRGQVGLGDLGNLR